MTPSNNDVSQLIFDISILELEIAEKSKNSTPDVQNQILRLQEQLFENQKKLNSITEM